MEIKGFIGVSLVDWDGKVSSVIFLPGCNLRCPFCYNTKLVLNPKEMPTIPFEEIQNYLKKHEGWIDGVVITGGEPTIQEDLPILCEEISKMNLAVKVDTNGTNPSMIRNLLKKGLINYVAMDVKAPLTEDAYSKASGVNTATLLKSIDETIGTLLESGVEYEFRTTLVPTMHGASDIEKVCEKIKGCRKYALQNFKVDVETIDSNFQNLKPFSNAEVENLFKTAKNLIPNTVLRG
jgi:pyruvate formate lyase activating enzyme